MDGEDSLVNQNTSRGNTSCSFVGQTNSLIKQYSQSKTVHSFSDLSLLCF